jgi:hypothetical protein
VPEGDHPSAQKESAVIERDEDFLVRLLRRLPQIKPGKQGRSGCPEEEALAVYLSGALGDADNSFLENHLASCAYCLDELLSAHHPAQNEASATAPVKAVARAMALLAKPKLTSEFFNLVVGLARDSLALISTSGRLVMPTLAAQIRGKEKIADTSVLHVESELGQFHVAVEVERLEDDLCQVAVNVKSNAGSVAEGLRLSLMSGEREQASYLARQGAAIFDRIPPGEYQLVVSGSGNSIGVIHLSIKEDGHERERKTD